MAVGGEVELVDVEVRAADHRLHLAGLVLDRHQRHVGAHAADPGGRVLRGLLNGGVDRGLHLETASEHHPRAVAVDQLLGQPGREVGLLGLDVRRVDFVFRGQAPVDGLLVLRPGDRALLEHAVQHQVAPLLGQLGVLHRVVEAGGGDHSRQQRRLGRRDVDRFAEDGIQLVVGGSHVLVLVTVPEIGAHRGLDAVGAVSEVDGVEVLGEDLVLGPLALEVVGERGLAKLLEHRAVALRGERVLDELLGDGRASLHRAAPQDVLPQRPADAHVVHALVLVVAPVLDRDHRVLDVGRDLALVGQDAVLVAGELGDLAAPVPRLTASGTVLIEQRVLGGAELARVLERRKVAGHGHEHPEDRRDTGEAAQPHDDQPQAQLLQPRLGARRPRRRGAAVAEKRLTARG